MRFKKSWYTHAAWAMLTSCMGPTIVNVHVNPQVTVSTQIRANLGPSAEADAFDAHDPRLIKAMEDTATAVGHGVEFAFDLPALPRPQKPVIELLFSRFLERIPDDLNALRTQDPMAFSHEAPSLRSIQFEYDGTAEWSDVSYKPGPGILTIKMAREAWIPTESATTAFTQALEHELRERYESWLDQPPATVPTDEIEMYVRYLTRVADHDLPRTESGQWLWNSPRARSLVAVLSLNEAVMSDARVHDKIIQWLIDRTNYFSIMLGHYSDIARTAPAGSPFVTGLQRWIAWANQSYPRMKQEEQTTFLRTVLEQSPGFALGEKIPGLAVFEWGAQVIEAWSAAGHPSLAHPNDPALRLFALVVPTIVRDEHTGAIDPWLATSAWSRFVLAIEPMATKLPAFVASHHDPVLAEAIATAIVRNDDTPREGMPRVHALWHALWTAVEPDARSWSSVTSVLSHFAAREGSTLYDESARLWRTYPQRHAEILRLLTVIESSNDAPYHLVNWSELPRQFGSAVTQPEYEQYLALDLEAVDNAWRLFPALAPNVSATQSLLPQLPAPVGQRAVPLTDAQHARNTLNQVLTALATRNNRSEGTAIKQYIDTRLRASSAQDQAELGAIAEMLRRRQP